MNPIEFDVKKSSESLKPQEVATFANQMRKFWGWLKYWAKGGAQIIAISILSLSIIGCAAFIRFVNELPIPEPPTSTPTPFPTEIPTFTPTRTPNIVPTATPTAIPVATVTPTPVTVGQTPVLVLFKVQGFNPTKKYNCSNPEDGPKFQNDHICIKDSTEILADPNDLSKSGPCDEEHPINWNSYCNRRDYDDPRGPHRNVTGARSFNVNGDNPFKTDVHFELGVPFTICIRPEADIHTADGINIPVHGTAASCVTETY